MASPKVGQAAFDRAASGYDAVAESALGLELRCRVRSIVEPLLRMDHDVVDLGCGSGLDAAWLAGHTRSVRAFDISPEMVGVAQRRCADLDHVEIECADVGALRLDAPADLVLANFGVVNCVGDLGLFGDRLASLLTPSGHAVVVSMAKWCPAELAIGIATLNADLVRRRFGENDYHGTSVRYASAATLARSFEANLKLVSSEALGVALPPFEQRIWVEGRPRLLRALANVDRGIGRLAARAGVGDHHIAVFAKRP